MPHRRSLLQTSVAHLVLTKALGAAVIVETLPARLPSVGISAHRAGSGHISRLPESAGIAGVRVICHPGQRPCTRGEVHGRLTAASDVRDEQRTARAAAARPRHRITWMDGQR